MSRLLLVVCSEAKRGNRRDAQLKSHLSRALGNGISREDLAEVATHRAFYAGWPTGMSADNVLAEVGE